MLFGLFKNLQSYKNLTASEFKEAVKNDKTGVILDVRSATEYRSGKIKGARNIDINSSTFKQTLKGLSQDKTYYVYCKSGGRSAAACRAMTQEGFKKVFNLRGGLMAWDGALTR